jgi:putative transposase
MPRQEVSIVEQRREFVRLAMLEGANRRELCRRFGIHPDTGYKWLRRWTAGEEALVDRSRRPQASPNRCSAAIEALVLGVRDAHPAWGARRIARCLERAGVTPPAVSTVHAILDRHGRVVAPPGGSKAWQCFEKDAPNLLWQMDFKGWIGLGEGARCHPLTVVDDHSCYVPCLAACADERGPMVRSHLETTFRRYGLPDAIFVDNGNPWGAPSGESWTRLGVWLLKLGIELLHSRPYHPQSRGKNERFHRTLKAEVFALARFRSLLEVQHALDRWREVYNFERPRQRSASRCRRTATGRARAPCPTACPKSNTTRTRSCAPCRPARTTSASRAGSGRSQRPTAANASPSAPSTATDAGASSSPRTRSPLST